MGGRVDQYMHPWDREIDSSLASIIVLQTRTSNKLASALDTYCKCIVLRQPCTEWPLHYSQLDLETINAKLLLNRLPSLPSWTSYPYLCVYLYILNFICVFIYTHWTFSFVLPSWFQCDWYLRHIINLPAAIDSHSTDKSSLIWNKLSSTSSLHHSRANLPGWLLTWNPNTQ